MILSSVLRVSLGISSIWPSLRHATPRRCALQACKRAHACSLEIKVPHDHAHVTDRNSNMPTPNPPRLTCASACVIRSQLKGTPNQFQFQSCIDLHACARLHLHPTAALDLDLLSCSPLNWRKTPQSSLLTHCLTKLENLACMVYSAP